VWARSARRTFAAQLAHLAALRLLAEDRDAQRDDLCRVLGDLLLWKLACLGILLAEEPLDESQELLAQLYHLGVLRALRVDPARERVAHDRRHAPPACPEELRGRAEELVVQALPAVIFDAIHAVDRTRPWVAISDLPQVLKSGVQRAHGLVRLGIRVWDMGRRVGVRGQGSGWCYLAESGLTAPLPRSAARRVHAPFSVHRKTSGALLARKPTFADNLVRVGTSTHVRPLSLTHCLRVSRLVYQL